MHPMNGMCGAWVMRWRVGNEVRMGYLHARGMRLACGDACIEYGVLHVRVAGYFHAHGARVS